MNKVLLPCKLLDDLSRRNQSYNSSNEQGGLLLGYRKEGALQVTKFTLPQRWDYATPTLFKRSTRGHSSFARDQWLLSDRTVDWLGEWHTHPCGPASPSYIDKHSWKRLAKHMNKPMVFLIFSKNGMYAGLQERKPMRLSQMCELERSADSILMGY